MSPLLQESAHIRSSRMDSTWSRPYRAHLVGACGSGMKALAEVLLAQGWSLTGSDPHANSAVGEHLRQLGLPLCAEHAADNVPAGTELLIYSPAVPETNPERQRASAWQLPQFPYNAMLGELMQGKTGISIAGTHGKSTATAMTGCILTAAGLDPTVLVGAEVCGRNANGWAGQGPHMVVESCEYRRHFLELEPQLAVILGIEADHFDCFDSVNETANAFREFGHKVPAGGVLLVEQQSAERFDLLSGLAANTEVFGSDPSADWCVMDVRRAGMGNRFRLFRRGEFFGEFTLEIPGRHHVWNAAAAAALSWHAGARPAQIREALADFRGIRRRFEFLGAWRGTTWIDDYAHHPTAVRATLATAREVFGRRRLVCIFQPHQVSRTLGLFEDFAHSFSDADEVWITDIFGARESSPEESAAVAYDLAEAIAATGVTTHYSGSLDQTFASLDDAVRPGEIWLTLGAGDIDRIHHARTRRLQRHHAAG